MPHQKYIESIYLFPVVANLFIEYFEKKLNSHLVLSPPYFYAILMTRSQYGHHGKQILQIFS